MSGKLYGIGIGPGDPELLTLKAFKLIKNNKNIAFPGDNPKDTIAYKIIAPLFEDLDEKNLIGIAFPMTKDKEKLDLNHKKGADIIKDYLDKDEDVVFLTLGDPTVYSTYMYVHRLVLKEGYCTEVVPGITSFCAASARLNESLVDNNDELHIIPSSYGVEAALEYKGTKVFMKAGSKIEAVVESVRKKDGSVKVVENCCMENEKIYDNLEDAKNAGYYTVIITK